MTDFSKWTDERINEAIFKSKGWVKLPYPAYPKWQRPTPEYTFSHFGAIPDYAHDWQLAGELLEELPADVTTLSKYDDSVDGSDYWECVTGNALTGFSIICVSENPKRAICEAWLAWKGQG